MDGITRRNCARLSGSGARPKSWAASPWSASGKQRTSPTSSYDAGPAVPDEEGNAPSSPPASILAVIRRDRNCPDWFPFQAGLTPREHLERMNAIELEQQRQALQVRLAEMELASRASSEKIEADSLEIARAIKSFTTKWTYVAAGTRVRRFCRNSAYLAWGQGVSKATISSIFQM